MKYDFNRLFIKSEIQERGTEYRECKERGKCSLGKKIPGNVVILTFRGMFKRIPGDIRRDSEECSRRFWGMFKRIP